MRVSIIGGGVYGSAVAYFFERFGDEDVHLFDRGTIAEGSTEKSAAIVRQHYSNEAHLRLAKRGRDVLANFEEYVGRDGGYVENGYLLLAGEDNKTALRENVALGRGVGVDVELLAPEEISRRVPALAVDDVAVGAIERDSGFADPVAVTQGFVEAARESGTDVHTNTPVTDVETDGRRPTRIRTTDGAFETDYVVNAAGPWGAAVGSMIGLDLPLSWHESKMAELESSPPYEPDLPTVSDVDLGLYAKPETTGHFVAGGGGPEAGRPAGRRSRRRAERRRRRVPRRTPGPHRPPVPGIRRRPGHRHVVRDRDRHPRLAPDRRRSEGVRELLQRPRPQRPRVQGSARVRRVGRRRDPRPGAAERPLAVQARTVRFRGHVQGTVRRGEPGLNRAGKPFRDRSMQNSTAGQCRPVGVPSRVDRGGDRRTGATDDDLRTAGGCRRRLFRPRLSVLTALIKI
jgi:glycine/D-amino acid oxidase-like deaminating enzyme